MISPRKLFQDSLKPESYFRSIMKSDEMQRALAFALAEFSINKHTQEELAGANGFIEKLLALAELETAPSKDPDAAHRLDHSVFPVVEHALQDKKDKKDKK